LTRNQSCKASSAIPYMSVGYVGTQSITGFQQAAVWLSPSAVLGSCPGDTDFWCSGSRK